jgi:transposase
LQQSCTPGDTFLPGEDDDFVVRDPREIQALLQNVTGSLTLVLAAVAAISLLVRGIGIMPRLRSALAKSDSGWLWEHEQAIKRFALQTLRRIFAHGATAINRLKNLYLHLLR